MKIIISNNSNIPIFEQIKNTIINQILNHELEENEMLPSIRSLAQDIRISVMTIKKADDLFKVSKTMTGSTANWLALYEQNKDIIGDNPKTLFPGQRLVVKL